MKDKNAPVPQILRLDPWVQRRLFFLVKRTGWLKSAIQRMPVNQRGEPLPWYTYGAIHFLDRRIKPDFTVFEFSSGNSTLWWAKRVRHVNAVEDSVKWYRRFSRDLPANVSYQHLASEPDGPYCRAALSTGQKFDIIAIDGRDRVNCAKYSIKALNERSVIVWDNSDRAAYAEGYDFLADNGFRQIEFRGPGPGAPGEWTTSVFYRTANCLGI